MPNFISLLAILGAFTLAYFAAKGLLALEKWIDSKRAARAPQAPSPTLLDGYHAMLRAEKEYEACLPKLLAARSKAR